MSGWIPGRHMRLQSSRLCTAISPLEGCFFLSQPRFRYLVRYNEYRASPRFFIKRPKVMKISDLYWKKGSLNIRIDMFTRSGDATHPGGRNEHGPGHVHVTDSNGDLSTVQISTQEQIDGTLDPRDRILVRKWVKMHREKLRRRFKSCMQGRKPNKIDGLVE